MLKRILNSSLGTSNLGWLKSQFHFSFAEYYNPNRMNFGNLRVVNNDIIQPLSGFDTHPHQNMEIVSYIIDGEITHKDSIGNKETLKRGEIQYLSAGNGITHSEHNLHESKDLHLLQIWIIPPKNGLQRLYGSHRFKESERKNKLLQIVSNKDGNAPIKLYQDVNFYVSELKKGKSLSFDIKDKRQVYFIQIEGISKINGVELDSGDAAEITEESSLHIKSLIDSHFIFIEMAKK